MTTEYLLGEDLLALQNGEGPVCLSVTLPTHRLSSDRRIDKLQAEKILEKAKQYLGSHYPEEEIRPLAGKLDELLSRVDFTRPPEGLGFYVSSKTSLLVHFPFPVEEKIIAGDHFSLRDLLYRLDYEKRYLLLLLSEKMNRLFSGSWMELEEVRDKNFPVEFKDDYIYNPPSRGTSYGGQAHVKAVEKDPSIIDEIRLKDFFRGVDKNLGDYLAGNPPLILAGVKKELGYYEEITKHGGKIIGRIPGNHSFANATQLSVLARPILKARIQKDGEELINEFVEKTGKGLGISGIREIWQAVLEGKAFKLLVEKDYRQAGFVEENGFRLHLVPPVSKHKILPDAVDEIIRTVLEKNGQVFFVENGRLGDYRGMALITRY